MSNCYNDVLATAQMALNRELEGQAGPLTPEQIQSAVSRALDFYACDDVEENRVVAELEASYQTIIGGERILYGDDEGYEPWLDNARPSLPERFWNRYRQYLLQEENWPQATIDSLDETSHRVLDLLTNPLREGSWDRRGMVVGHVQSGKTANYVGLITKAVDAGYKLVVVLAGFHKSLRSQTQIRLEEGFLGYDRASAGLSLDSPVTRVGVGFIDPGVVANTITTRADNGDFKRQVAENFGIAPGGHPLLFVVKKNGNVLKNLLNWVRFAANATDENGRPYVSAVPLLVIDDEADQGSIDTKDGAFDEFGNPDAEHNPTVLNQRIRQLLHLFDQSAYVGYTATPFANILIHESAQTDKEGEDLFPRSFIVSLPSASNYVGPAKVFGYEDQDGNSVPGLPIIQIVDDHAETLNLGEREGWIPPRHRITHKPRYKGSSDLPPSLKEAVKSFVIVVAARAARGDAKAHNSMLIHVTRFTAVQALVAEQVRSELRDLVTSLKYGDGESPYQVREQFRDLWEDHFIPTMARIATDGRYGEFAPLQWSDIEHLITHAAQSIRVREINGKAGEVLDYKLHEGVGLNVIAIGGDKLSRGLTLEGLSISYFLRASRMYDTLMQMGRWFGYRPRYLDLVRLYTTAEMIDWFSHIAGASEELREDFDRMAAAGGTPKDFGHRVRSHPLMMVTSQVKMRHGTEIDISYEGAISETINFWRTKPELERNWAAGKRLISDVEAAGCTATRLPSRSDPETLSHSWIWSDVDSDLILSFLHDYTEHRASKRVKTKLLADYIKAEVKKDRLVDWTILLASGDSEDFPVEIGGAVSKGVRRGWHLSSGDDSSKQIEKQELIESNHFRIRRLVSPADEAADLSPEEYATAFDATVVAWQQEPKDRKRPDRPAGPEVRRTRNPKRGLLLLYPLNPRDVDNGISGADKTEADAAKHPVLGFAISFPSVSATKASKVKYVVGNIYYQQELGLEFDDGDQE